MEDDDMLLCIICGVDSNKKQKHQRYNYVPSINKKKGKYQKDESDSDDSDDSLMNSKSKKRAPPRASTRVSVGSRQTRNQNPKTFAASLCKMMDLPATPDHPFLQIFSRAHYCSECMPRVKEVHSTQMELESLQEKVKEAKVDFEIDLSKHLQAIHCKVNLTRNTDYSRYEEDIKTILDFTGNEKKIKKETSKQEETVPKRERRQAAIKSTLQMKRKLEENDSEDDGEEEEEDLKVKKPKKKEADEVGDKEFLPDDSASSETEKEEPEGAETAEKIDETEESCSINADNGSNDIVQEAIVVQEEKEEVKEKPVEIIRVKKDPKLKCPHCPIPRYFNIAANMEEHINKAHAYVCDVCEKTFKSDGDLKKHTSKVHVQKTDDTSQYVCGFCDQDFQLKKYLEDHLDQHPEAKPLNCHQCGRGFSRKESLQKAFQIYKGENVEPCGRCGKNLNLKDYLEHNRSLKQS